MVATAGCRYYNVLSVILVTQSCIIHQMKGHFMLYYSIKKCHVRVQIYENAWELSYCIPAFCFFLRLYLSHNNTQYVKRQVILWPTTLYTIHILKSVV